MSTLAEVQHEPTSTSRLARWAPWGRRFLWAAPGLIVALAVILRLVQYLHDRSLFLDEAFVATNIAQRSFAGLLQELTYDQRAPAGFLLAVKAACVAFGRSDLMLRLLPLLAGCAAAALFYGMARCYVSRGAALLGSLFFALCDSQIFYSSDLKQYSCDVLAAVALLWAMAAALQRPAVGWRAVGLGLLGAVAVWFSLPAVTVLAGLGLVVGVRELRARQWSHVAWLIVVGGLWAAGFAALYLLQIRHYDPNPNWKNLWAGDFLPLHGNGAPKWLFEKIQFLAGTGVGLSYVGLALLAVTVGAASLGRRSPYKLALLLAPLAMSLLLSAARIYPLGGRASLYLAPAMLLLVVEGLDACFRLPAGAGRYITVAATLLLLLQPVRLAAHAIHGRMYTNPMFWGYRFEEMKPLLRHVKEHWQPGDLIYLYNQSNVAFYYYADAFGLKREDSVEGMWSGLFNPPWTEVRKDVEKYRGRKRVWFLFTHIWTTNGVDEEKLWLYFLDDMGRRLDQVVMPGNCGASVYLYDLSPPAAKPVVAAAAKF